MSNSFLPEPCFVSTLKTNRTKSRSPVKNKVNYEFSTKLWGTLGRKLGQAISDPWPTLMTPSWSDSCGVRRRPSGDPQSHGAVNLSRLESGPIRKISVRVCRRAWRQKIKGGEMSIYLRVLYTEHRKTQNWAAHCLTPGIQSNAEELA